MTLHLLSNVLINVIPYVVHKIAEKKTRNNLFFSLYLSFESFSWLFIRKYIYSIKIIYILLHGIHQAKCVVKMSVQRLLYQKFKTLEIVFPGLRLLVLGNGFIDHVVKLHMHWYIIQLQSFPSSRNMLQFHKIYHLILFFSWI